MVVYLGLGSNLGNREENLKKAIKMIGSLKKTRVIKISNIIQTDPVGGPVRQPKFLNAALRISTEFSPAVLLKKLKNIELKLGRKKTVRYGPRVIDLDILLYDDKIIRNRDLLIPHPRMFKRDFVIRPLLEVL
jgi:dihydroneopterin aldolase/2-amino-4-hydroxy-6-hydroxymethyldihydropteridine diphosphokinase